MLILVEEHTQRVVSQLGEEAGYMRGLDMQSWTSAAEEHEWSNGVCIYISSKQN